MKRRTWLVLLPLAALAGAIGVRFRHRLLHPFRKRRSVDDVLMANRTEVTDLIADGSPLALLAFKEEQRLELWKREEGAWVRQRTWPFTATSGMLGPKLREGDRQIPEGLYKIEYLNPNSRYHLSMKVDYPNAFDRQQAAREGRTDLGGDIFIHGKDVTIGCIPIGDPAIEDLFAVVAANGKDTVRVIIAPRDLRVRPAPQLAELPWTVELYEMLRNELEQFPVGA